MGKPRKYDPLLDQTLQRTREAVRRSRELVAKSQELQRQSNQLKNDKRPQYAR